MWIAETCQAEYYKTIQLGLFNYPPQKVPDYENEWHRKIASQNGYPLVTYVYDSLHGIYSFCGRLPKYIEYPGEPVRVKLVRCSEDEAEFYIRKDLDSNGNPNIYISRDYSYFYKMDFKNKFYEFIYTYFWPGHWKRLIKYGRLLFITRYITSKEKWKTTKPGFGCRIYDAEKIVGFDHRIRPKDAPDISVEEGVVPVKIILY